jgi:hypothetical protein
MREYRLKRRMKVLLSSYRLNPDNWHYTKANKSELVLIHKHTGHARTLPIN